MEWPTVSIVVLNYNGRRHLADCFGSLMELDYPSDQVEVLFVDNASGDDSVAFVDSHFPRVQIVQNQDNVGFSAGNNRGAQSAKGEYVVFLNNDTRVDSQWLKELVRPCLTDVGVACTASKMLAWDGKTIDFVYGSVNFHGFAFQPYQKMTDFAGDVYPLLFACGGAMLIRRDVFLSSGQFDEDYFLFFEDVDLGWRLWLQGHRVLFVPSSIVYHHLHATTDTVTMFRRLVLFERNALVTLLKNYDDDNLHKVWPAALMLACKRSKRLMQAGGWSPETYHIKNRSDVGVMDSVSRAGLAVLVAVNEVIEQLPQILEKRAQVQARRKRSDSEIFPLFRQPLHVNPIDQPALDGEYAWAQSQVMELFGIGEMFADLPRRVLVVSSELLPVNGLPTTGAGLRAWSIGQGLLERGHEVLYSMPRAAATGREAQIDGTWKDLLWEQGRIGDVVNRATPDVVIACGLSLLSNLSETTMPVVLDLHEPHLQEHPISPTNEAEKLAGLRRTDFFTCASERQLQYFLPWLTRAGFDNPQTHSAVISVCLRAPSHAELENLPTVRLEWRADVDGLVAFCRTLGKRGKPDTDTKPSTVADASVIASQNQWAVSTLPAKHFRRLLAEGLHHLRQGGLRVFIYEILGFLRRQVQP